jgi:predicted kinase
MSAELELERKTREIIRQAAQNMTYEQRVKKAEELWQYGESLIAKPWPSEQDQERAAGFFRAARMWRIL